MKVVKNSLHLQQLNDVRIFLKVALLSDKVTPDYSSFQDWVWNGPPKTHLSSGPIDGYHYLELEDMEGYTSFVLP